MRQVLWRWRYLCCCNFLWFFRHFATSLNIGGDTILSISYPLRGRVAFDYLLFRAIRCGGSQ